MSTNRISIIEKQRQSEQARLDLQKSAKERNELGQFATPGALAQQIAKVMWKHWARRKDKVRFLDPGIGTGSFYAALRQEFPLRVIECARGVEIDERFVKTARSLWKGTGLDVQEGDFIRAKPPKEAARFNLVLTNPPYVRHHHLDAGEKVRLQSAVASQLGIRISGLAGLYCYFLLMCDRWLSDDGLAAWLIPSEFMDVKYGAAVKEYLTTRVRLLHVHRFDPSEVQFDDALVTSAVVVFQKGRPRPADRATFSYGGTLMRPRLRKRVALSSLRAQGQKWTAYPHGAQNGVRAKSGVPTLGDLFTIKRGIATGANGFFILPREIAHEKGIPKVFLRPILPSPRYVPVTVIESDDEGYPTIDRQLSVIDCGLPEDEVRRRYPSLWSYLEEGKEQRIHERYLTTYRSPWYSQEKRPPAPFLCTYMGRDRETPFRFIWNKSQATAANVYLLLYPKEPVAALFAKTPELYERVFEVLQRISPESFIGEGRVYGGGLFKMEPKELARLSADLLIKALGGVTAIGQQELMFR